ncbi:MAG: glycosyltransferase [Candidatus Nanopelagicales bacterium]|jgi:glycosyltransferase involved in cell wall biosynthesis|nr:glycosyltransferase [Candidatus Nanopelagicales bacterium]
MATVDVVVRTKNRARFLARALDDVLAQDFADWRLIVVNDGGAPEPVDRLVAERPGLAGRTEVLHLAQSLGYAPAANRGVAQGASPLVALHDDDDTWDPRFLQATVDHLSGTDDQAVAVRTELVFEREMGTRIVEIGREVFHPLMQEPTYFDLIRFNHVVPISMLIRRSAWEQLGGFDETIEVVEDWVLNLSLALDAGLGFIDGAPLAFWHHRPESVGDAGNSVIAGHAGHIRSDRRVRDRLVREYVRQHGPGGLLYLSKYIDERTADVLVRLERIEARQDEILARLDALAQGEQSLTTRLRSRVSELRG